MNLNLSCLVENRAGIGRGGGGSSVGCRGLDLLADDDDGQQH
jgi:hypothetical protein